MTMYLKSASERGSVLGEEAIRVDSVLDLVNSSDKEFLLGQRSRRLEERRRVDGERAKEMKAKRYAEYIVNCRKGLQDAYGPVEHKAEMTEWEVEKEREEFTKYGMMACFGMSCLANLTRTTQKLFSTILKKVTQKKSNY